MNCENYEEAYSIENKTVSLFPVASRQKTRGEKTQVSPIMLLKTNVEKMSENRLPIMLLKIKLLKAFIPLYL